MAAKNDAADLAYEIDALRRMTVKDLRRRHVELFGTDTRGEPDKSDVHADIEV